MNQGKFLRRFGLPVAVVVLAGVPALQVVLNSGDNTSVHPERPATPAPNVISVSRTRDADDLGRFLAGLSGREGSPFVALESEPTWREHASASDRAWSRFERERLPALSEFARRELDGLGTRDPVFYPFGGPDALTVTTFFPHHSTYVLVGLEPPGTLPSVSRFPRKELGVELTRLRGTFDSLLQRSFFITWQMDHQLRGQVTDGVLPLILVELVRSGYTVLGCESLFIDDTGRMLPRHPNSKIHDWGFALDYRLGDAGPVQRMYYWSVNLANSHLSQNPEFQQAVSSLGPVVTYLKSTSYMPHHAQFSLIRDRIVEWSAAVLQDDSGVPYRLFEPAAWHVQLYGDYQQPYGSFRYMVQPDLRLAYRGQGVKSLDFRIGYGYGRIPSNLQLAQRAK